MCHRLTTLARGDDDAACRHVTALFDFLAACAEGENKFIESLCQKLLSVDEILDIVSDVTLTVRVKAAFVRCAASWLL